MNVLTYLKLYTSNGNGNVVLDVLRYIDIKVESFVQVTVRHTLTSRVEDVLHILRRTGRNSWSLSTNLL